MRNVVLDIETTGLDVKENHRVIEIGCLEMIDRRLTGECLHFYINPNRNIDKGAQQIHGITQKFLQDKPVFAVIAQSLIDFIKGSELIIHNAAFDIGFLNYELELLNKNFQPMTYYCSVVDSLAIARRMHPGQQNNLDALCRRYQVDNSNRDLHGALLDAQLLAQVYLRMTGGQIQLFENENKKVNVSALLEPSHRLIQKQQDLPILYATDQEQLEHQQFLQMMREKGCCLWKEEH